MDPVPVNNSPDLTMEEITKQLFNNELMWDIQFQVEGRVIFAHSWELMKRSIVFREQFRDNLGVHKFIPIVDTAYEVFYQFLRFIYTDVFDVNSTSIVEMLKLAIKYKITKLETSVLNMVSDLDTDLKLFEFSVINEYKLGYEYLRDRIIESLDKIINSDAFNRIDSEVVRKILESGRMTARLTEVKLFNAVAGWFRFNPARQQHLNNFKRLIRFPIMTHNEFRECMLHNSDLLTPEEISAICQQILLGTHNRNQVWISRRRLDYSEPFICKTMASRSTWETKFSVSNRLVLYGLRFGCGTENYEIHITGKNRWTTDIDVLSFKFMNPGKNFSTINLGELIKLQRNVDYTIEIKFTTNNRNIKIFCRKPSVNMAITGYPNWVTFSQICDNLFEIFFKLPID